MPNTYTQIHIQLVFAVKHRAAMIESTWKYDLYKYMTGITQNHNHKLLAINGIPDHVHILIGMRPVQSLAELVQQLKQGASKWINENRLAQNRSVWQEGYGAFSYGMSQLSTVIRKTIIPETIHPIRSSSLRKLSTISENISERMTQLYR